MRTTSAYPPPVSRRRAFRLAAARLPPDKTIAFVLFWTKRLPEGE